MPTKTPAPKLRDTEADLMRLVNEGVAILVNAYEEGRELTFAETSHFRREWLLSDYESDRLMRRFEIVARNQEIAGTTADREALAKAADDAAERLEQEGPKIREQIEKLQKQLNAMERERDQVAKRTAEAANAVTQLRNACPLPLQKLRDGKLRHLAPLQTEINSMLVDCRHLENLLQLDPGLSSTLDTLASHTTTRHCVTKHVDSSRRISYTLNGDVYKKWRAEAVVEAEGLRGEISEMQAEYDRKEAEIDQLLNYWVR